MASTTDVWNQSLANIGVATEVSSGTQDTSAEAALIRRYSTRSLNEIKRSHRWQDFSVYETMKLVKERPNKLWGYAYKYPNDCLFFDQVLSNLRNEDDKEKIPFARGRIRDDANKLVKVIFTDITNGEARYVTNENSFTDFDDDFASAWAFRISYFIAPSLTGGDPFQVQRAMLENYKSELHNAIQNDRMEQQRDPQPPSKYEKARSRSRARRRIDGEELLIVPSNSVIS